MPTLLPRDDDNVAIPALRLKDGGAHKIAFTAIGSARNAVAFNTKTRVASFYATTPVYLRFGDATVVATTSDHYFPAGIYYDMAISEYKSGHYTHVAVRGLAEAGTLYISEKE